MGHVSPAGTRLSRRACYDRRAGSNGTLQPLPSGEEEWRKRLSPEPHPPLLQEAPRNVGLLYCTRGAVVPLGSLTKGCLPLTPGDLFGVELDGDVRYAQDSHEPLAVYDGSEGV